MLKRLWLAVMLTAVASCGEEFDVDGADDATNAPDDSIVQVSSAITYNGHDYLFFHQVASWDSAKAIACRGPYYLAQINSAAENAFIAGEASRHGGGTWWIGYSDKATEGLWQWEAGNPVGYINWQAGEPNNYNNEDCAWLVSSTGKWFDAPCASGAHLTRFVCESGSSGIPPSTTLFSYTANDTASATRNTVPWAVNLTRNSKITIGTVGIEGGDYDGDTFLRLKGPTGAELAYNDDAAGTLASNLSYVVPSTGTYTIHGGCYDNKQCWGAVAVQVQDPY